MNINRRILAVMLSAVLVLTLTPLSSFAVDGDDENTVVKPVSATILLGKDFKAYAGESELEGLYAKGNSITVKYSNGSEEKYLADTKTKPIDDMNVNIAGYFPEGGEIEDELQFDLDYDKPLAEGNNTFKFRIYAPYTDEDREIATTAIDVDYQYYCGTCEPTEVKFVPAEGFVLEGALGYNCIEESAFYGEGNKFLVKYRETTEEAPEGTDVNTEYIYVNEQDEDGEIVEGFYAGGDVKSERFDLSDGFDCDLNDKNCSDIDTHMYKVELTYYEVVRGREDLVELPFTVDIKAEKYNTYYEWKVYSYTGKVIKPKFVVRRTYDDKVVPSTQYTFKAPANKKMGYYNVDLTFKDEFKDQYMTPVIEASYGIGPTKPTLKKVARGKKSLTVTWKKFTKAQLKTMDKMYIEVATDKNFYKNYKRYTITKKNLKKGKAVLKKLKAKKKYYVQMYTYKKTVKQNGEKFSMRSDDSNMMSAKTK